MHVYLLQPIPYKSKLFKDLSFGSIKFDSGLEGEREGGRERGRSIEGRGGSEGERGRREEREERRERKAQHPQEEGEDGATAEGTDTKQFERPFNLFGILECRRDGSMAYDSGGRPGLL